MLPEASWCLLDVFLTDRFFVDGWFLFLFAMICGLIPLNSLTLDGQGNMNIQKYWQILYSYAHVTYRMQIVVTFYDNLMILMYHA